MDWIIYNTRPHSIVDEVRSLCTFETDARRVYPVALAKVLEPEQAGPVWYAAVKCDLRTPEAALAHKERGDFALQADNSYTFAAVLLTTEEDGWEYILTDELSGPWADHAPALILDVLTPTSDNFALDWRHRCGVNLVNKQAGTVVAEHHQIQERTAA